MKTIIKFTFILLALVLVACTRPQPATTPTEGKDAERANQRTAVTSTTPGEEQLETEDMEDSKVTGFGEDPGEETQE